MRVGDLDLANGAFRSRLEASGLTADRTLTVPDKSGTIATTADVDGTPITFVAANNSDSVAVGQHKRFRITDGVFRVATLPASPSVGDRVTITVSHDSNAPVGLNAGTNRMQGLLASNNQWGWVAPRTSRTLVWTGSDFGSDFGWDCLDANLLNLAYTSTGGFGILTAKNENGAWATAPTNLLNLLNLDSNSTVSVAALNATTSNFRGGFYCWQGFNAEISRFPRYFYTLFDLIGTGGFGEVASRFFSVYGNGNFDNALNYFVITIPTNGNTTQISEQIFSGSAGQGVGVWIEKANANSYCNVLFRSLVILD